MSTIRGLQIQIGKLNSQIERLTETRDDLEIELYRLESAERDAKKQEAQEELERFWDKHMADMAERTGRFSAKWWASPELAVFCAQVSEIHGIGGSDVIAAFAELHPVHQMAIERLNGIGCEKLSLAKLGLIMPRYDKPVLGISSTSARQRAGYAFRNLREAITEAKSPKKTPATIAEARYLISLNLQGETCAP